MMRIGRIKHIVSLVSLIFVLGIASSIVYTKCIDGKEGKRYKVSCENNNVLTIRDSIDGIFKKNNASSNIVIDYINFQYTKEFELLDGNITVIDLGRKRTYDITICSGSISYSKEEIKREEIPLFEDRMNWYKFETILDKLDSLDYSEGMKYAGIFSIFKEATPFAFNSCKYYCVEDDEFNLLDKSNNKVSNIDFDYGIYLSELKSSEDGSCTSANEAGFMILY